MTSICARASATEIDLACSRLGPEQADELRARVKLVLRNAAEAPRSILVACDASRSWVVWNAPPPELLDGAGDGELVETLLDVIERRARRPAPSPAGPARPARPIPTSPHETPTWDPRSPAPAPSKKPLVESGGIGLGLAAELLTQDLGPALGPRLDIGVGWGPWSLQLEESARLSRTHAGQSALLYDLGVGFGWGAPFSRRHPLGAALGVGGEWFNVEGHTVASGFSALGLRGALSVGPWSLALGIEGRLRWSPQYVGERVDVGVPRWSGLLLLEGLLLVEPPLRDGAAR